MCASTVTFAFTRFDVYCSSVLFCFLWEFPAQATSTENTRDLTSLSCFATFLGIRPFHLVEHYVYLNFAEKTHLAVRVDKNPVLLVDG